MVPPFWLMRNYTSSNPKADADKTPRKPAHEGTSDWRVISAKGNQGRTADDCELSSAGFAVFAKFKQSDAGVGITKPVELTGRSSRDALLRGLEDRCSIISDIAVTTASNKMPADRLAKVENSEFHARIARIHLRGDNATDRRLRMRQSIEHQFIQMCRQLWPESRGHTSELRIPRIRDLVRKCVRDFLKMPHPYVPR